MPEILRADVDENLRAVRERIARAAASAGRSADEVRLLAVSKGQSAAAIRAAHAAGQRDFGENYAQELSRKAEELSDLDVRWHAIGRVQRNKARVVARFADVCSAVDRATLVEELGRHAGALGKVLEILVEVNVSGETAKAGCAPAEVGGLLEAVEASAPLRLIGLMTMAPEVEQPDAARPFFAALRELRELHGGRDRLPELSMGMSSDFEAAIAEGATLVRVGTAIFGRRAPAAPSAG